MSDKKTDNKLTLKSGRVHPVPFSEQIQKVTDKFKDLKPENFEPVPIGIPWLDEVFSGGRHPANMYLLLGKQNVGKTTDVIQELRHVAKWSQENEKPYISLFLSFEHSEWDLFTRLLCVESWIISSETEGDDPLDYELVNEAVYQALVMKEKEEIDPNGFFDAFLQGLPDIAYQAYAGIQAYAEHFSLYHASRTYTSISEIKKIVAQMKNKGMVPYLMVDYLQSMPPPDEMITMDLTRPGSRDRIVGVNIQKLASLSEDERIPVLAVSSIDKDALKDRAPVHLEDADGDQVIPFTIDGAVVLNPDQADSNKGNENNKEKVSLNPGDRYIRRAVEKNRNHGPSGDEHRHILRGGSFYIEPKGELVKAEESYQSTRVRDTLKRVGKI